MSPRIRSTALVQQFLLNASPPEDGPTSMAQTDSGRLEAAVSAASAVAAVHAFAVIAVFVAGAAAPPAVAWLHSHAVGSGADVPDPAVAGVSGDPVPALRIPFPAVAGISDPVLGCLYSERRVDPPAEGRADGRVDQRCYFPDHCSAGCCSADHYSRDAELSFLDAEPAHCSAVDFRHDLRRD